MTYRLEGHDRNNAVQDLLICLLPDEEHVRTAGDADCVSALTVERGRIASRAAVRWNGRESRGEWTCPEPDHESEEWKRAVSYTVKTALFNALTPLLESPPPWGSMTGVKPAKPARLAHEAGMAWTDIPAYMTEKYYVEPRRAGICTQSARYAADALERLEPRECQLYVGIPFCPAKCSYCSFVSNDTQRSGHLLAPYLEALEQEIAAAGVMARAQGLTVGSLYLGGGTPTVLSANQLDRLLGNLSDAFDLRACREITVEAGRPETIDGDKLRVMADHGVHRISINPQSMDDAVLARVGRFHTAEDIRDAVALARKTGDFLVNMDLIAGLSGDSGPGLLSSCRQLIGLGAENITIHSLARKRGAPMFFGPRGDLERADADACYQALEQAGYEPYYLYRQKYIAGGLENTGWCKPGTAGWYNICMMEELCDVIALGAGGVTKYNTRGGEKIRRVSNPKYPKEYIEGIGGIVERKGEPDSC